MKTLIPVLIVLIASSVCSAVTPASAPASVDAADEYEIKAAMYVNLLRLVDWPSVKRGDSSSPIVIGVSGSSDMAQALEAIAGSKSTSADKRIIVVRLSGTARLEECDSVFVGGGDQKKIAAVLQTLGRNPVLTVGENDRFVALGGMIDLILRDDKVQIEVNLDLVRKAGLTIGSQLLRIAIVKEGNR